MTTPTTIDLSPADCARVEAAAMVLHDLGELTDPEAYILEAIAEAGAYHATLGPLVAMALACYHDAHA